MNIDNEEKKFIKNELTSNSKLIYEDGLNVLIAAEFERYLKNIDIPKNINNIKFFFNKIYYTIVFNEYLINDKNGIDLSYYKNELFKLIIYSRNHSYDNFFELVENEMKRQASFDINLKNMVDFLNLMIVRYIH